MKGVQTYTRFCVNALKLSLLNFVQDIQEKWFFVQVFDSTNPYLKRSEEYQKQMKNLKWLLGLPFEITVKIDTEYLHFNDAKDDLKDDALKRDAFFASVHTVVALNVLERMRKGTQCTAPPVKKSQKARDGMQ